jgi:spectinomycin phosphotransferase
VNVAPAGLDERELIDALAGSWGLDVEGADFVPKGFGSYHWVATGRDGTSWFLTVDDLDCTGWLGTNRESAFAGLRAAFDVAAALGEQAELEFVVAPIRTHDGDALCRISSQYTLGVFPTIEGTSGHWGDALSAADGNQLIRLLADLHRWTPTVSSRAPHYAVELSERAELEDALTALDQPWAGGPFSEPARAQLATKADAVFEWLASFDRLAAAVAASGADDVITHGEPHPGNLIRAGGRFHLIDWDTVGTAPPERDLWMLAEPTNERLGLYTDLTARVVDPAAISLYRQAWTLKDLAAYVALFRSRHERTEDTEKAWRGLSDTLGRGDEPLEQLVHGRPPWRR